MRWLDEEVLTKRQSKMMHPKDEFNMQVTLLLVFAFVMFGFCRVIQ